MRAKRAVIFVVVLVIMFGFMTASPVSQVKPNISCTFSSNEEVLIEPGPLWDRFYYMGAPTEPTIWMPFSGKAGILPPKYVEDVSPHFHCD